MTAKPDWLPEILDLSSWTERTYDELYELFKEDFIVSKPIYKNKEIWYFKDKEDEREKLFWHLTSKDDDIAGERIPDLRRSERLKWIKPIIENSDKEEILEFDHEEGTGTIKTYLWLKDYDFVVIMKKYNDGARRIITSFYIEYGHTRRKMEKKFRRSIDSE